MSVLSLRLSASFLRHSHQAHHVHISRAFVSSGAARRSLSFTHTHTRNYVSSGTGLDVRSPRMGPLCARHTHTVAICVNALQHSATTATQPMPRGGCLPGATTCVTMQTSLPLGVCSPWRTKFPLAKPLSSYWGKKITFFSTFPRIANGKKKKNGAGSPSQCVHGNNRITDTRVKITKANLALACAAASRRPWETGTEREFLLAHHILRPTHTRDLQKVQEKGIFRESCTHGFQNGTHQNHLIFQSHFL